MSSGMSQGTTTADSNEKEEKEATITEEMVDGVFELDVSGDNAVPSTFQVLARTVESIVNTHPFFLEHEFRIQDGKPTLEIASQNEQGERVTIFEEGDHYVIIYTYSDKDETRVTTEQNIQQACIRAMEIFNVYE
jgi:hypothetical protein